MERKYSGRDLVVALVACVVGAGVASGAITMDTVPVGNAGNAADTPGHAGNVSGQGSVGYAYNIGKYEVTAGQYTAFLNAVAGTDTYGLYNGNMANTSIGSGITQSPGLGGFAYSVDAAFTNRPVNFVSFGDAMRFANWLNNGQPSGGENTSTTEDGAYYVNGATSDAALNAITRKTSWQWALTSEDEWYKAAYYNPADGSYYLYATGSNTTPGRDLSDALGNDANYAATPYPIESPYYTTPVGQFANTESPYGTYDQSGNVLEWNESLQYNDFSPHRGVRGGSFSGGNSDLQSDWRRNAGPSVVSNNIGFRVVEVPEPASLGLMGLGAVGMLARRRR